MTTYFQPSVLPESLHFALGQVRAGLERGKLSQSVLETLLSGIGELPLAPFDRIANEIAWRGGLYSDPAVIRQSGRFWSLSYLRFLKGPASHSAQLSRTPRLSYLFLFHANGYLREAALKGLAAPLPNAFFVVALVYRLNDWVPQVRAAAAAALARVGPITTPEVIAKGLLFLLPRASSWGRWTDEAAAFESLLARADVSEALAAAIGENVNGPMARILRYALRRSAMDGYLPQLLREARQPAVRALALTALADRAVHWRYGPPTEKRWIDKSMGRYVNVQAERQRTLECTMPISELVKIGARDKASPVRLAAATALARHFDDIETGRALAEQLANDKRRAVRERAAYLLR